MGRRAAFRPRRCAVHVPHPPGPRLPATGRGRLAPGRRGRGRSGPGGLHLAGARSLISTDAAGRHHPQAHLRRHGPGPDRVEPVQRGACFRHGAVQGRLDQPARDHARPQPERGAAALPRPPRPADLSRHRPAAGDPGRALGGRGPGRRDPAARGGHAAGPHRPDRARSPDVHQLVRELEPRRGRQVFLQRSEGPPGAGAGGGPPENRQ